MQLEEKQACLDELVDVVVEGYHQGFAKSIQNYSQILQLFAETKEQVDSLKKGLADAIRQLGAQSNHLNLQVCGVLDCHDIHHHPHAMHACMHAPGMRLPTHAQSDGA